MTEPKESSLPVAHIGCIHYSKRGYPLPSEWQPCTYLTTDDKTDRALTATRKRKASAKGGGSQ